ncbi:MAG TPA: YgiT-type zinc finger protein [Tepidisphaeraceae bacterium]|jgi:YgiT-type zinc finger domain-containing protein
MIDTSAEHFEDRLVTYTLELNGKLIVIEHVPARVSQETGEQLFAPSTVERIHAIILGGGSPKRFVSAPVYEFAA